MHPILENSKYISFRAKPNVELHDSGYKIIENDKGETYDFITINYSNINGIIGQLMLDIDKDGWIKMWDNVGSDITKVNDILPLRYVVNPNMVLDGMTTKTDIHKLIYTNWANQQ